MAVQNVPNPIIHKVEMKGMGNETRKAKTRLDEVFEEREERAAKRFSAAELEKMALESENEAARLRGEPPKYKYYGGGEVDEEERKKREEQRTQMLTSAKALIDSGMEPTQVGQMLMGLTPTGTAPVVTQGMGIDDILKVVNLVVGKKETDELKGIIVSLEKKIDDLAKGGTGKAEVAKPIDPITFAKQQAEAVREWNKTIRELMPEAPPVSDKGEPLAVVQERNRHAEKMEEIKTEGDYKRNITEIAAEIPERIGRGLGQQFAGGEERVAESSELEYLPCVEEGCGFRIPITPTTGDSVTCPKCGTIYSRKATIEAKAG